MFLGKKESDLADKIKRDFFQLEAVSVLLYGCTTNEMQKESAR